MREEIGVRQREQQRLVAELVIRVRELCELAEVGQRERYLVIDALLLTALEIGVAYRLAERRGVYVRIFGERAEPARIMPAAAGLELLGGDHIGGHAAEGVRDVDGRHEAGVEADEIEGRLLRVGVHHAEGRGELAQGQRVVAVGLVEGGAGHGAAAVVPEEHHLMLGGKMRLAEIEEGGERLRLAPVRVGLLVDEREALAVEHEALNGAVRDGLVMPLVGSARLDDDADVFRDGDGQRLVEVVAGAAVEALEVAPADVPVDRPLRGRVVDRHGERGGGRRRRHWRRGRLRRGGRFGGRVRRVRRIGRGRRIRLRAAGERETGYEHGGDQNERR